MTSRTLDILVYWATGLIAGSIVVLTLLPMPAVMNSMSGTDKVQHFLAFFALTLPLCARHPRAALWLVPIAVALGGAIEIIQPFFGRAREFADFLADFAGACTRAAIGWGIGRKR